MHEVDDFNPRPLAGATACAISIRLTNRNFNPRPLAGATRIPPMGVWFDFISIHAPLRGRLRNVSGAGILR